MRILANQTSNDSNNISLESRINNFHWIRYLQNLNPKHITLFTSLSSSHVHDICFSYLFRILLFAIYYLSLSIIFNLHILLPGWTFSTTGRVFIFAKDTGVLLEKSVIKLFRGKVKACRRVRSVKNQTKYFCFLVFFFCNWVNWVIIFFCSCFLTSFKVSLLQKPKNKFTVLYTRIAIFYLFIYLFQKANLSTQNLDLSPYHLYKVYQN